MKILTVPVALGVLFLSGCEALNQIANSSPAAVMPSSAIVSAVYDKNVGWVTVSPNAGGDFEMLPSAISTGLIVVVFDAPWPGSLKVTIDGAALPDLKEQPGATPAVLANGYYNVENIDPTSGTPHWKISVRPPAAAMSTTTFTLGIAHVSINPQYPVGNPMHESSPLTIKAVARKIYSVTIVRTGLGRGTVTSFPAGLDCGVTCTKDFGAPGAVTIKATPSGDSTFTGWSGGGCQGTNACAIPLTGTAVSVTANFDTASPGTMTGCMPAASVSGYMYVGAPACASNDIAGHPNAMLYCDEQGYFCCEDGGKDSRCSGVKHEFPADCMDYGPKVSLHPGGCYTHN